MIAGPRATEYRSNQAPRACSQSSVQCRLCTGKGYFLASLVQSHQSHVGDRGDSSVHWLLERRWRRFTTHRLREYSTFWCCINTTDSSNMSDESPSKKRIRVPPKEFVQSPVRPTKSTNKSKRILSEWLCSSFSNNLFAYSESSNIYFRSRYCSTDSTISSLTISLITRCWSAAWRMRQSVIASRSLSLRSIAIYEFGGLWVK